MAEKKLRGLYVDCAVAYLNPTATFLPELTAAICDEVDFFGPGFSDHETLAAGLLRYCDTHGPFDAIFFGTSLSALGDSETAAEKGAGYVKRYTANDLNLAEIISFLCDYQAALPKLGSMLKIAYCLNYDYYGATQEKVDWFERHGFVLVVPGSEFVSSLADLPVHARQEEHYQRKSERLSDAWKNFLDRRRDRVISAVHFVASGEFFHESLATRPIAVSVPGVGYVLRKRALRELAEAGLRPPRNGLMFAYSVANKLRLPVFSRFLPLRMYNLAFQRLLSRSSLIYTASEGFGIPIRKYFEIPAAGAAMLCAPCNGFKEIGFRPGEHYVHTIPDDLVGAALELAKDLGKAQVIARSCQAMVREKHSLTARAGQLRNCLDLLLAGTYAGSQWIGGEHRIEL